MILTVKDCSDCHTQPTLFGANLAWILEPDKDCYGNFTDRLAGKIEIGCCYSLWVCGNRIKTTDGIVDKWRKILRETGDTVIHKIRAERKLIFIKHFVRNGEITGYSGCNIHLGKIGDSEGIIVDLQNQVFDIDIKI